MAWGWHDLENDWGAIEHGVRNLIDPEGPEKETEDETQKRYDYIKSLSEKNIRPLYDQQINRGDAAYNQINPIVSKMGTDPTSFINDLMGKYTASEAYKQKLAEMMKAAHSTAAAGGMVGTDQDQDVHSRLSLTLQSEDMQNWLNNVLGVQNEGIQALGHFYDNGQTAQNKYSDEYLNMLSASDTKKSAEERGAEQAARMQRANAGAAAGGIIGYAWGGPQGAAAGSQIGQGIAGARG